MKIIKNIEQYSDEWWKLCLGSIGGSSISAAVAKGQGKQRTALLYKKAGEILTGIPAENYKFMHADRGHEYEPEARGLYEFIKGVDVEQIAMIKDGDYKHCSPDGLVGDDGMTEIKTRIPSVFIEAVETGMIPTADKRQCHWSLAISGRNWIDYCQYCPEIPKNNLFIQRLERDEKKIAELYEGADAFIADLLKLVKKYK